MKKIILILIAIALLVGGYYLYMYWALGNDSVPRNDAVEEVTTNSDVTNSQSEIGLEFDYPEGPDGYIAEERMPADLGTGLVKNIILTRTEDTLNGVPAGGEYPPAILISIFENSQKQFPRTWADDNTQYSNINLVMGEVQETVIGGANAIRYMADGLYASENIVVAHGDHMYVITGQFIDEDSAIARDYEALVESVRFIPTPGQN